MGGLCSTPNAKQAPNPYAGRTTGLEKQFEQQRRQRRREVQRETSKVATAQPTEQEPPAAESESPRLSAAVKESPRGSARFSNVSDDEFYDGIPRYQKSSSYLKSRSMRAAKVEFLFSACLVLGNEASMCL